MLNDINIHMNHKLSSHMELTLSGFFLQILRGKNAPGGPSSDLCVYGVLHQQQPGHTSTFLQLTGGKYRWGRSQLHKFLCVYQSPRHGVPNHTSWPSPRGNRVLKTACKLSGGEHASHPGCNHSSSSSLPRYLRGDFHEPQAQGQCILPFLLPHKNVCGQPGQNWWC